ncbi:MAG: hypothetical protein Q7S06_01430 [Nanoarchaeota archaeon]|nr:hypothetical protein [Nanoarchaeota archaeon]
MILGLPLAIWLGFLTFGCLITTASFGIAFHVFHKNVFKYHKFFAFLTIGLATTHFILAGLLWFFGVSL